MSVQTIAKVLDTGVSGGQDDGRVVVGQLTLGLCVDADELQVSPHLLEQIVEVPLVMGAHGYGVRYLVDDVELLDGDLIDLVEAVDARYVDAVALDHVDQVVDGRIAAHNDVGVVNAILAENGLDCVQVELAIGRHHLQVDAALLLSLEVNIRRLLVEPNAEAFQLVLQYLLVQQRPKHVEHNKNQAASARHYYQNYT